MWLKLKKTGENVEEINTNIAIAMLLMMRFRDQKEIYDSLSEDTKRKKLSRLYENLYKNRTLSEEVMK